MTTEKLLNNKSHEKHPEFLLVIIDEDHARLIDMQNMLYDHKSVGKKFNKVIIHIRYQLI